MLRIFNVTLTLFLASTAAASAELISVDFNLDSSNFPYSGPGVLGASGDVWNNISGPFSNAPMTTISLSNSAGNLTGVTLSYDFDGFFDSGSSSTSPVYSSNSVEYNLMRDYAYTDSGNTASVSLDGLAPGANYRLILYSSANRANRTTAFTVAGVTQNVSPVSASTLIEGVNYADFTTMADALGQISITFQGIGTDQEGNLNGLQIQGVAPTPVPEPASLVLWGIASLGFLGYRLRPRRRIVR